MVKSKKKRWLRGIISITHLASGESWSALKKGAPVNTINKERSDDGAGAELGGIKAEWKVVSDAPQ